MKAVFFMVHLVLAALAAWQGYHILTPEPAPPVSIAGDSTGPQAAPAQHVAAGPAKSLPLPQIQAVLVQRNLFKADIDAVKPAAPPPVKPDDLTPPEKTTLELALWGTVSGNVQEAGWAVIEDKKLRRQDLYRTGDTVMGARIKQITRNRVILSLNGKDQMLETQTQAIAGEPSPIRQLPAEPSAAPVFMPEANNDDEPLEQDPEDMLDSLKSRPYIKSGSPAGLLVYGIRPGSQALAMGLRNGDIIKSINDMDINSTGDLKEAAGALEPDGEMTITLSRRGQEKQIVYKGADE